MIGLLIGVMLSGWLGIKFGVPEVPYSLNGTLGNGHTSRVLALLLVVCLGVLGPHNLQGHTRTGALYTCSR